MFANAICRGDGYWIYIAHTGSVHGRPKNQTEDMSASVHSGRKAHFPCWLAVVYPLPNAVLGNNLSSAVLRHTHHMHKERLGEQWGMRNVFETL